MADTARYIAGAELPDLAITWRDSDDAIIDYSSGWTFAVAVTRVGETTPEIAAKTSGITGNATAPNITIAWAAIGELNDLTPGRYRLDLTATRTADNKERKGRWTLIIE